jgi:sulfite exporter TauE/SafE
MTPFLESFVFGAANSVHCACMCGPLALSYGGGLGPAAGYQGGRLGAYTLIGLLLGAAGSACGSDRIGTPSAWIAFVLAAGLVLLATVGERGALRIPGLGSLLQRLLRSGRSLPPATRALLLGALTPLLPCGLLWAVCAGASIAGSATAGALVMAGFTLGSLPLLLLVQTQAMALARRFSPTALATVQRVAMLGVAALLVWRGAAAFGGGCCH